MKKILLFVLLFFISSFLTVNAYELVLPKEKKSIVNTNYAFFVGKAGKFEDIVINDEKIYIASNGAFAHSVKLKDGENRIIVKSNLKTTIYRFYKNEQSKVIKPELIEFEPVHYTVVADNTPLRSTPVDYGMNRLSHLFKDTNLIINGELGSFYRVYLSKEKYAWVAKDKVVQAKDVIVPAFITTNSQAFKNASVHTVEFTEKLPYTMEVGKNEILFKIYNPFVPNGAVYTVTARKPTKYNYKLTSCNGVYVLKVCELQSLENRNLEGITILVDAGHGGSEKGAIGCLGDKEKDINLNIALELQERLKIMGANVIMTRECDANVELDDRVKIAKENCADIFVSIHLNSIPDIKMDVHKNRGTRVYYYNENSRDLAKIVEDSVADALKTKKAEPLQASFAVIRPTDYVGILVEVAFMTNPIDSVLYTKDEFPNETAKAIAEGILNYVNAE